MLLVFSTLDILYIVVEPGAIVTDTHVFGVLFVKLDILSLGMLN